MLLTIVVLNATFHNMQCKRELKEIVIGSKMPLSIVKKIDAEAVSMGVSRSAIMRWALIDRYSDSRSPRKETRP